MLTKLDDIHGLPMRKGTVICPLGMGTTQLLSSSHGFEGIYDYSVRLSIPGTIEMKDWCEENCEHANCGSTGSVFWSFMCVTDAVAFKLRWS